MSGQIKKALSGVIAVPGKLNRFIDGVESGDVRFHPSRGFEQRILEQNTYLANRIVKAVLASGLIIAGSQLLDNFYVLGVSLFSVGGIMVLTFLRRDHSVNKRVRGMGRMGSGFKKPRLHP